MRERGPSLAKTMKNVSPICLSPHPLENSVAITLHAGDFAVFMPEGTFDQGAVRNWHGYFNTQSGL